VCLPVLREDLDERRVRLVAIRLETGLDHAPSAKWHDRALERRLGLQTDDDLAILVDVPRTVREDAGWHLRDVDHAFLALLRQER